MASIRRRGSSWQARITRHNQPSLAKSFDSKSEALRWARQIETQLDGTRLRPKQSVPTSITLAEVLEKYRVEVTTYKRGRHSETYRIKAISRHWIGNKRLRDVSKDDVYDYREERLKCIQPSSLRRELNLLSHVWNLAKDEWGLPLPNNPFTKVPLPRMPASRQRRLSAEEETLLLKSLGTLKNRSTEQIVRFAIATGLRRSEILRLEWTDIDDARRCLHVKDTKNGSSRWIPITEEVAAVLRSQHDSPSNRVFPVSENALKLAWTRSLKKAGIYDLHFHDLRHEALSRWAERLNGNIFKLCQISGHKTLTMAMRYVHPLLDETYYGSPFDRAKND